MAGPEPAPANGRAGVDSDTSTVIFSSVESLEGNLRELGADTYQKYNTYNTKGDFGKENVEPSTKKKTWFKLKGVQYDGSPFQMVGTKLYGCHLGKDKNKSKKDKYHAQKSQQALEDHVFQTRYRSVQNTKKMDCPVQFYAYHIIKFPEFKISEDTPARRRNVSEKLRDAIADNPSSVKAVVEYHTSFPSLEEHQNHPIVGEAAQLREDVDETIVEKIKSLTRLGVKKISEMRRHLVAFVTDVLFKGRHPPPPTRRRYTPTNRDIWNRMASVKDATKDAKQDQRNVQILADQWSSQQVDCRIRFRPSKENADGTATSLLFCYQAAWQRRLLHKYGQQMCLLDATYRTCRYRIPLFFLCVRTNVCYSVVGVFVPQTEKSEDIREALQVFREWNPDWQPSHFMVDFCEAEIGALEEEFPDSEVLLCDFHREKAWVEWVRKKDHGVFDDQRTVLCLLRNIAAATTHDEYNMRVDQLKASNIWQQSAQLRTWFSTKWLTNAERWVHVFRDENLKISIYTNNGVERQNETLKYSHLEGRTRISLSEMITVVVTDFLPTSYRRYIQLNVMYSSCYRRYNSKLPRFLHDRPRGVVTHIMSRMEEAAVCFNPDDIGQVGNGVFHVKSTTDPSKSHIVNFGASASNMPFCTCKDWSRNKLPCKHFCAVFTLLKEWGWEKLASAYKDNPILSLDHTCLGQTAGSNERDDSSSDTDRISTDTPSPPSPPPPSESSYLGLPEPKRSKKKLLQMECASLLREITNLTYNVEEEYLRSFKQQLVNLMEDMQQNAPRDDSVPQLPIDASQLPKKRKRETPVDNVSDLPTRPSKHPSSRRVGHRAEMMRETLRVNVSMDTIVEENEELETYIESDLEAVVDCDMENDEAQNEWLVINDTKLTQKDRQILQEELWLNDKHINSAQKLISNEYPLIDGLGDTVILTANQQGPVPASSDCVQMHNVKDHWVVSTSVGGNITVYDSLQPSMKPELRSQLANLYRQFAIGEDSIIPVNVVCAQRQQGGNDCGLFAIANAVAIAEEIPPTQVVFEQGQMRRHFEECLERNEITMFPHDTKVGQANTVSVSYQLTTYCCYEHRPGSPMIMCDKCAQWYHYSCVSLSDSEVYALVTQEEDYVCPTCHTHSD